MVITRNLVSEPEEVQGNSLHAGRKLRGPTSTGNISNT